MNSRKKSILIYLGGIITGIILTFAFFTYSGAYPFTFRQLIRV